MPWKALIGLIELHYPKSGRVGRPPIGVERMLGMYLWHFGMKAHIGVDADSGLVHSVHVTSANESDVANTHALLHGQELRVHADSGYTGVAKREEIIEAQAEGRIRQDIDWHIAAKRGTIVSMAGGVHNHVRMFSLLALANLVIAKRPLLGLAGVGAS